MTNENANQAITTTQQQEVTPAEWGDRQEIAVVSRRIKTMLPNGNKMSDTQAYAAAQYTKLTGLDPFTGGFYPNIGYDSGIFNSYKTLVSWAQTKEAYSDKYYPLTLDERELEGYGNDVVTGWKCYLIKRSDQPLLLGYIQAGLPMIEALDLIATKGIGVVVQKDTTKQDGKSIDPPKTWTWDRVAKKRALRNAISLAYGQPTLNELRALGERVRADNLEDIPASHLPQAIAASIAADEIRTNSAAMTIDEHRARLRSNVEVLRTSEADIIDNTDQEDFARGVSEKIPFYASPSQIWMTLARLGLTYDPENEAMLFDELAKDAAKQADLKAAA